ncbi:MAG: DNA methyltransferase [Steroidobacteraceae bacterium]
MALSWNEIRSNALAFSKEWADESSEDAEAKSFWDAFFAIFGVTRRRVASFEEPVTKSDGRGGYIDLLWRGLLLVEHKSRGKDLNRAFHQATDYFHGLKERDLPRYVLVSDFARFRLYDLDEATENEFPLADLHKHIGRFGFVAGYQTHRQGVVEEVANIKAAEQLGKLHDQLKAAGYEGHALEVLLVRVLFCLFADDTGIFERRNQFKDYLEVRTSEDGVDIGQHLSLLFQVLNTEPAKRQMSLDELLASFTYVNGRLFEETLPIPAFDRAMRETLLDACGLDWSRISPAIFGSLFQSIMDKEARRNLGAHYTRESNILKALRPLFLDALDSELTAIGQNSRKLMEFQKKLASIRILDPACGCGNFLVIAYRELRRLELEVLRRLYKAGESSRTLDIASLVYVDVDQFYGIEIEEFPAQIAQVALWLTDHQMNQLVSEEFGHYFVRLPLKKAPNIVHGNALRMSWEDVLPAASLSYIVGNPPFKGHHLQSPQEKADMVACLANDDAAGVMDYVTAWFAKAADYIRGTHVSVAFVATNSITQGEQVGILWRILLGKAPLRIHFAHRTFKWSNEARNQAAVYCVIIGFAVFEPEQRWLFDYETPGSDPVRTQARMINAYLVDAPWTLIQNRSQNPFGVPDMMYGSKPTDDGNFLFTDEEKITFLREEPGASKFVKPFLSAHEYLHGKGRWVLWLVGARPEEIRALPKVLERVEAVDRFRKASKAASTRDYPHAALFRQVTQPKESFVLIPRHSSENRRYVPFGFFNPENIVADSCLSLPGATPFHYGVIQSAMHMVWLRYTCGRLKSDYRYSKDIVYNNFPWPDPNDAQREAISQAAQGVLDARAAHPDSTLADLYDPLTMPPDLLKAHQKLDRAVDAAYGRKDFKTEVERVAFLFECYQALTAPLAAAAEPVKFKRGRKKS